MESLAETRSVRERTESSLADELKKEKQALQAKDAAMKGLEKSLTAKVHALEAQMHEKEELLQSRSTELEALTSEVTTLSGRLTDWHRPRSGPRIYCNKSSRKKWRF